MSYYHARPCDIEAYRNSTRRGVSSAGVTLIRVCHKCGKKGYPEGYKKVSGTGTSRHNPSLFMCQECK